MKGKSDMNEIVTKFKKRTVKCAERHAYLIFDFITKQRKKYFFRSFLTSDKNVLR